MDFLHGSVRWAQFGRASSALAKLRPLLSPPVLVLSNPRNGSSWVGETLGTAPDAAYLYEPFNQTFVDLHVPLSVTSDSTPIPPLYAVLANATLTGLPVFSERVVKYPDQWHLLQRPHRRLVIKEVRLSITRLLLRHFQPRCILLVRHPAAVALSHRQLGWLQHNLQGHTRLHSQLLRSTLDTLTKYREHRIVMYEELCADPVARFRSLFEFAHLTWTATIENSVRQHSAGGERQDTYGTFRNSQSMIDTWRGNFSSAELAAIRDTYSEFDLPWYRSDADWQE